MDYLVVICAQQLHAYDAGVPLEETLHTANDLVRSGKVRYIGGNNLTGWQLQKAVDMARYMGLSSNLISLQVHAYLTSYGRVLDVEGTTVFFII